MLLVLLLFFSGLRTPENMRYWWGHFRSPVTKSPKQQSSLCPGLSPTPASGDTHLVPLLWQSWPARFPSALWSCPSVSRHQQSSWRMQPPAGWLDGTILGYSSVRISRYPELGLLHWHPPTLCPTAGTRRGVLLLSSDQSEGLQTSPLTPASLCLLLTSAATIILLFLLCHNTSKTLKVKRPRHWT